MPTTTGLTIPFIGLKKQYNNLRTEILETGSDLIVGDSVDVTVALQAGRTSYDRAALLRYLTPAELADCSTVGADSVVLRIRAKVR